MQDEILRDPTLRPSGVRHENEPWRTPAQVDIDRILYSSEFRRLAGVTQVIPPQVEYQFHDRLSHSIKVAQVASSLARQLVYEAKQAIPDISLQEWVDPDVCYAAALAHDIGHPPFGHVSEKALQRIFEGPSGSQNNLGDSASGSSNSNSDFIARSFEGNAQSMRIVATLCSRKFGNSPGLNLTYRTLAAIAKYPWRRGRHPYDIDKLKDKWSFYPEESHILQKIEELGFIEVELEDSPEGEYGTSRVKAVHRWVEAEIMDWADDISYAVHDIEDFFRAGLTPLNRIAVAVRSLDNVDWNKTDFSSADYEFREFLEFARIRMRRGIATAYPDENIAAVINSSFEQLSRLLSKDEAPRLSFIGTRDSQARLQHFGAVVISYLSSASRLKWDTSTERVQLYIEPEAVAVAEFFKALNKYYIISGSSLAVMQSGQINDVNFLFQKLLEQANVWITESTEEKTRSIPMRLLSYIEALWTPHPSGRSRDLRVAVLDYLAGLDDIQASRLTEQLRSSSTAYPFSNRWLDI